MSNWSKNLANSTILSRRGFLDVTTKAIAVFGLAEPVFADQKAVSFKLVTQSGRIKLPTESIDTSLPGIPGLYRTNLGVCIPQTSFRNLNPGQNWKAVPTNAQELGKCLGAFCEKNAEHEIVNKLDTGAKSAKCLLELVKQVASEEIAADVLGPLSVAMNLLLLALLVDEYVNYQIDKEMYKAAVAFAGNLSLQVARDQGSNFYRLYHLDRQRQYLEEKVLFYGSNWTDSQELWVGRYKLDA